jgi:hypothetical protein
MKANKVVVKLTTETLSIDSVPALLIEVAKAMQEESMSGYIKKEDGDEIIWESTYTPVEF